MTKHDNERDPVFGAPFLFLVFVFLKALVKTLFHFFSGWFCGWQKNESVFCAVEWVGFFYKFIF